MKKEIFIFVSIAALMLAVLGVLSGCNNQSSQGSVEKETAEATTETATSEVDTQQTTATSDDALNIMNCVKGTPWSYESSSTEGTFKVSYVIDGKTQYNGKEFCKVIGHSEGTALPAGYDWEYYFRWDQAKNDYAEVCYKISFPGAPAQEGCSQIENS